MTILKYIGTGIAGVVVGLLLAGAVSNDNLGGVYSTVSKDFSAGINAGPITFVEKTETVTADNTLTVSESGTTYFISTNVSTTTLPEVAKSAGVTYKFAISAAVATNDFRVVSAEGDNIEGSLIVAGAVVDCDAADRINFVTASENLGDFVEVRSNGTNWFVTQSNALSAGALTCSG